MWHWLPDRGFAPGGGERHWLAPTHMGMDQGYVSEATFDRVVSPVTVGIDYSCGQWTLSKATFSNAMHFSSEQAFVSALCERRSVWRFPQIAFRVPETIERFLGIEDSRLRSLQDYVRQVRRSRNFLVFTFDEAAQFLGSDTPAVPAANAHWFHILKCAGRTGQVGEVRLLEAVSAQVFFMLKPSEDAAFDEHVRFVFEQFLAQSDRILSMSYEPERHGVRFEIGADLHEVIGEHTDLATADGVAVFWDQHGARPRVVTSLEAKRLSSVSWAGWLVPLGYGELGLPRNAGGELVARTVPVDVIAAAGEVS